MSFIITALIFHYVLKTYLLHKSFPPITVGTHQTPYTHYWTV